MNEWVIESTHYWFSGVTICLIHWLVVWLTDLLTNWLIIQVTKNDTLHRRACIYRSILYTRDNRNSCIQDSPRPITTQSPNEGTTLPALARRSNSRNYSAITSHDTQDLDALPRCYHQVYIPISYSSLFTRMSSLLAHAEYSSLGTPAGVPNHLCQINLASGRQLAAELIISKKADGYLLMMANWPVFSHTIIPGVKCHRMNRNLWRLVHSVTFTSHTALTR